MRKEEKNQANHNFLAVLDAEQQRLRVQKQIRQDAEEKARRSAHAAVAAARHRVHVQARQGSAYIRATGLERSEAEQLRVEARVRQQAETQAQGNAVAWVEAERRRLQVRQESEPRFHREDEAEQLRKEAQTRSASRAVKAEQLHMRAQVLPEPPYFLNPTVNVNNSASTTLTSSAEAIALPRNASRSPIPARAVTSPFTSKLGFVKWAGPCLVGGFGGYVGSAGLHYASYNFVHRMKDWNGTVVNSSWVNVSDGSLAKEIMHNFSSLSDPVEANFFSPPKHVDMGVLDTLALAFPALFTLLAVYTQRCEVWTKVMVCTGLLAACKGIIGAMTTVPDSSGWETCRDTHLGSEGFAWLRQEHSFFEIVTVDFWWFPTHFKPLRYCSDMMFSGHTFFVTLYALGLYEIAQISTSMWHKRDESPSERGKTTCQRCCILLLVSLVTIGQQAGEIYFVLLSRFHYTSDVFVALLLTFLFYTNGAVCVCAKQWAVRDVHFLTAGFGVLRASLPSPGNKAKISLEGGDKFGDVDVRQCCCGPCGCMFSRGKPFEHPLVNPLHDVGMSELADSILRDADKIDRWVSRADIFVPWCCFPFCCLAGREHIYSDKGIESLSGDRSDSTHGNLHMGEGISDSDTQALLAWWRGCGVP